MHDIADELGLPFKVVEGIVNSQFSFVADVISKGDRNNPDTLKNVNVQYFGKFAVKETRKRYYEKLNNGGTEDTD